MMHAHLSEGKQVLLTTISFLGASQGLSLGVALFRNQQFHPSTVRAHSGGVYTALSLRKIAVIWFWRRLSFTQQHTSCSLTPASTEDSGGGSFISQWEAVLSRSALMSAGQMVSWGTITSQRQCLYTDWQKVNLPMIATYQVFRLHTFLFSQTTVDE